MTDPILAALQYLQKKTFKSEWDFYRRHKKAIADLIDSSTILLKTGTDLIRDGTMNTDDVDVMFGWSKDKPAPKPSDRLGWLSLPIPDFFAVLYTHKLMNLLEKLARALGLLSATGLDVSARLVYFMEYLAEKFDSVYAILSTHIKIGVKNDIASWPNEQADAFAGRTKGGTGGLVTADTGVFAKRPTPSQVSLYREYAIMFGEKMGGCFIEAILDHIKEKCSEQGIIIGPTTTDTNLDCMLTPTVITKKACLTTGADLTVVQCPVPTGSIKIIPAGLMYNQPDGLSIPGMSRSLAHIVVCSINGKNTTILIPAGSSTAVLLNEKNAIIVIGDTEVEFRYYPCATGPADDLHSGAALRIQLKE